MYPAKEVVVTGTGVVAPNGIGRDDFWAGLKAGRSGISLRPGFEDVRLPHRIAGTIDDFRPRDFIKQRKSLKIMCRPIQYGCAAAAMAFQQADFAEQDLIPERVGTVFGTETFFADPNEVADVFRRCTIDQKYHHERWGESALREIQPLWMLKYLPNMAGAHISIALDARGPSNSICQGEASSLLALIEAADLIQRGIVDVVVTGGTGSQMALTATLYRGADMLSRRVDQPEQASRPFDRDRDGMVVGEGAAAIVLESREFAQLRGANILATVGGWSRGYHPVGQAGFAEDLDYHLRTAIQRSKKVPESIDWVNANASGDIGGDREEAIAVAKVLGDTPVVAYKSLFGNLGPGTSMVELVASIMSLQHQQVPASTNCPNVAGDCPIRVLNDPLLAPKNPQTFVKSSFSATGQIAMVVLEKSN